jgi:hypothetical protein
MAIVVLWIVCLAPHSGTPTCSRPFSLYNALSFSDKMRDEFPGARVWIEPERRSGI